MTLAKLAANVVAAPLIPALTRGTGHDFASSVLRSINAARHDLSELNIDMISIPLMVHDAGYRLYIDHTTNHAEETVLYAVAN